MVRLDLRFGNEESANRLAQLGRTNRRMPCHVRRNLVTIPPIVAGATLSVKCNFKFAMGSMVFRVSNRFGYPLATGVVLRRCG